jgi:hypothetical protein
MSRRHLGKIIVGLFLVTGLVSACDGRSDQSATRSAADEGTRFDISFSASANAEALDGRIILIITPDDESEPRFQVNPYIGAPQIFGVDVDGLAPGTITSIETGTYGFPLSDLADVPAGQYTAQAVLNVYETFELSTGHVVKLPEDNGEGQQWAKSPGNLYSTPQSITLGGGGEGIISIVMDQVIEPIAPAEDSEFIRHISMRSELLSEFWGRDIVLTAHVLVPAGFDDHPEARYPIMINHGHFPSNIGGFQTTPPDLSSPCIYSDRFSLDCYNHIQEQEAYSLYQQWTAEDFPRFLVIEIEHPTPYYDDSYAVNSAAQGPYGDALTYEFIPFIEEAFNGIGEGWSRFTYGGSTGGWEAMAVQIFYPQEYNGAFVACPDPIDFRAYELINLYEDTNAYYIEGPFGAMSRPSHRNYLGQVSTTVQRENQWELVLGTKGRSGQQWDIWQATYSPMGPDGYPAPIWDKESGEINQEVADYWRENFDLMYILRRDWETLGPQLEGKLHLYVGEMDNYYLNNAVYLAEEWLETTSAPYYGGVVDYGARDEHCWNGDHENGNAISRLRYHTMYLPQILERIAATAPEGADLTSWRY